MDNKLSASQTDIGESSNVAQLAQTYSYTFNDSKYDDYACILAVIAQIAIDSSKRLFDIDVPKEIRRIKKDMDIKKNNYPIFWKNIKRKSDTDYKINESLTCPMDYLCNLQIPKVRGINKALPIDYFFYMPEEKVGYRKCKAVEEIIQKYSLKLLFHNTTSGADSEEEYMLLRSDFEYMLQDIQKVKISNNYIGLFAWLIDRAFRISPRLKGSVKSTLETNKALLLKTLYDINPDALIKIFSNNVQKLSKNG